MRGSVVCRLDASGLGRGDRDGTSINRRQLLVGGGAGAVGAAAALGTAPFRALASDREEESESMVARTLLRWAHGSGPGRRDRFSNILFNFNAGVLPSLASRNGAIVGNFEAHVGADSTLLGTFTAHGILGLTGSAGRHFHRNEDSSDAGQTSTQVTTPEVGAPNFILLLRVIDPKIAWARIEFADGSGLGITYDGGLQWTRVLVPQPA